MSSDSPEHDDDNAFLVMLREDGLRLLDVFRRIDSKSARQKVIDFASSLAAAGANLSRPKPEPS